MKRIAISAFAVTCMILQPAAYANPSNDSLKALVGIGKWALVTFGPSVLPSIKTWVENQARRVSEPQSNGQKYQWSVSWQADGTYSGIIWMNGAYGYARITDPLGRTIFQDIQAVPYQGSVILTGSNARDPVGRPYSDYTPDRFRLQMTAAGLSMVDTCDLNFRCAQIIVNYASPYK